jgi:hypothetical protein
VDLENSSIYREINAILKDGAKPVHYIWSADIHVNGKTYAPLKVISVDFLSDYEANYSDVIIIKLAISGGTYAKRIYPYKDKVDITLYRSPLDEISNTADISNAIESERYTATLIDQGSPVIDQNGKNTPSEEALNLTNIFEISFQLINKALEQLRLVSVGGIYRNVGVQDVVTGILTKESKNLKVDGIRRPKGVDVVPVSNKAVRDHVVIPQGTQLVYLPEYVQKKCGGIYSAGLGYYYQNDYWYLYPCFDTTRFNSAKKTLTVINIPANRFPSVERSYRQSGTNTVVLATGQVRFKDDSEVQQLNDGNGVRFADADKFMNGFTETSNNKTIASRGTSNSEYVATQRATRINNVKVSSNPINSNTYLEASKLARRQGSVFSFVWENSLPSLVYPGMMVKVLYLDDTEVKEVFGVLLKAHHYVQTQQKGLMNARHITRSALSVFVKRPAT